MRYPSSARADDGYRKKRSTHPTSYCPVVVPAQAGIQRLCGVCHWIPAYAGTTDFGYFKSSWLPVKVCNTSSWCDAQTSFGVRCYDAIRDNLTVFNGEAWPTLATLNAHSQRHELVNHRGHPIRFVAPNDDESIAIHYEQRIAETGEIATRENWHDFFNATQWLTFPKSKAAISEMHTRLMAAQMDGVKVRTIARDVLTLFDEGGVIVASADESLLDHVRNFEWKKLFIDRRAEAGRNINFYLAGHSVLEKMLDPFVGVTAKALLLKVDNNFFALSHDEQLREIDSRAAAWLMNESSLASTRNLHPLPILGIPGWFAANESPSFYDDAHYFRSGYSRDRAKSSSENESA